RGDPEATGPTIEFVAGTPEFMSPEQCRGSRPDARSDIYACGCVLYFLSTGRPPFSADSAFGVITKQVEEAPVPPSVHNPGVTVELRGITLQAFKKNPDKRFKTARNRRSALASWPGEKIPSTPPAPLARELALEVDVFPAASGRDADLAEDLSPKRRPRRSR